MSKKFPPRGSGVEGDAESAASGQWAHPWQLGPSWDWKPGSILLGEWEGRLLGLDDDRQMMTIAGNRGGKSTTVLIPNLRRYPGSVVVLDPKGELTRACADARRKMGQLVYVLDPFGETDEASASHNPLDELGHGKAEHVAPDAAQLADANIVSNERDPHWTDSAKNLTKGFTLQFLSTTSAPSLREVRRALNATPAELDALFAAMANSSAFDGVVGNIGSSFLGKMESAGRELQSILSTAQEQTAPLDDVMHVMERSDFKLRDLSRGNITIFLVLPAMRMATHYRWLRQFVQLALGALERYPVARGKLPVWFVLEEFASLGYMRSIEMAAGLMAGFGVKLWSVLQDLSQLKAHYPKSWETFLGNAGVVQAFGNADFTTAEYLSKALGNTTLVERQKVQISGQAMSHGDIGAREHLRHVRLLEPSEVTMHFARETGRQLLLVPGKPPIYCRRLGRDV